MHILQVVNVVVLDGLRLKSFSSRVSGGGGEKCVHVHRVDTLLGVVDGYMLHTARKSLLNVILQGAGKRPNCRQHVGYFFFFLFRRRH